MNRAKRTIRNAFTFIEMLVVITVIVIIMLIALPSYSVVTELGRRTVCKANMHQNFLASNSYMNDNSGAYPPDQMAANLKGDYNSSGRPGYGRNVNEIPSNPNASLHQDSNQINPLADFLGFKGVAWKNTRDRNIEETEPPIIKSMICPSNEWNLRDPKYPLDGTFYEFDTENGDWIDPGHARDQLFHFYEYNYEMTRNWWRTGFRRPKNLATTLLYYDQDDSGRNKRTGERQNLYFIDGNHKKVSDLFSQNDEGVHLLYCDGNLGWLSAAEPYKRLNYLDYTGNAARKYMLVRDMHGSLRPGKPYTSTNGADYYNYGDYDGIYYYE